MERLGASRGGMSWSSVVGRWPVLYWLVPLNEGEEYHMQGRQRYRWGWGIVGLATVMAVLPVAAWACAVCFDGDDALARGLNMSILFLLSMPYAIVGAICSIVYLAYRRAQRHGRKELAKTQKAGAQ